MGRILFYGSRYTVAALAAAALALSCAVPREEDSSGGSRPQPGLILLIVVDTLRVDHLGAYGYSRPLSPAMDRLATEGVLYEHAYSVAPWTTPSVGALLSSQFPSVLGITDAPHPLPEETLLLPEVLQQAGWTTGAVVSHYFLGKKWRFDQGFDLFDESNIRGHSGICSPGVTDTALRFLQERGEEPLFLFLHYFDPHYDYIEHPEHRFSEVGYGGPVASAMEYDALVSLRRELEPQDVQHLLDLYDSEIAFTDREIGRLLDGVREAGLYDDALILLTADHGEEFLDRKTIGHGGTLYNELIQVPLILKYPAGKDGDFPAAGRRITGNVSTLDIFPTLLDYLQISLDHPLSGRSFLGAAPGTEPEPRLIFAETDWGEYRAVLRDRLKMIHRIPTGQTYFFDLDQDPREKDNLTAQLRKTGRRQDFLALRDELRGWMEFLEKATSLASPVKLSEEEIEALKALGYLN